MTPRNLIEELGRRLNTALALDDAGLARIVVDDSLPVDFELDEANERLLVYSVIGILPAGKARERFFEELLAGQPVRCANGSLLAGIRPWSATRCFSGSRSVRKPISTARPQTAREPGRTGAAMAGSPQRLPTQARRRPALSLLPLSRSTDSYARDRAGLSGRRRSRGRACRPPRPG